MWYNNYHTQRPGTGTRWDSGRQGNMAPQPQPPIAQQGLQDRSFASGSNRQPYSTSSGNDRQQGSSDNGLRWSPDDYYFLSKQLSFLLRHGAEKAGYKMMDGGYLYVDEILYYQRNLYGFTEDDVRYVVSINDKKRFAIEEEAATRRLKIRANQGHTLQVENLELTPITKHEECPVAIHGTYFQAWNAIKMEGLSCMGRNHIHLAAGEPGQSGVISGMRKSCEVMIFIDMEKALKDGIKFFRSANNVILTTGNEDRIIHPRYFDRAVQRNPYGLLPFDKEVTTKRPVGADSAEGQRKKKKKNKGKKNKNKVNGDDDDVDDDAKNEEKGSRSEQKKLKKEKNKDEEAGFEIPDDENVIHNMFEQSESDPSASESTERDPLGSKSVESDPPGLTSTNSDPPGLKTTESEIPESWETRNDEAALALEACNIQDGKVAEDKNNHSDVKSIASATVELNKDGILNDMVHGAEVEEGQEQTDVHIEDEWDLTIIKDPESSQSAVMYIEEERKKDDVPLVVVCKGRNKTDPTLDTLILVFGNKVYIYNLPAGDNSIIRDGRVQDLFHNKDIMKVFHGCAAASLALFKQFNIVLDGTRVYDTKIVFEKLRKDKKCSDELEKMQFPPRHVSGDETEEMFAHQPIEGKALDDIIDDAKLVAKSYHIMKSHQGNEMKKDIFEEVNRLFSEDDKTEVKKQKEMKRKQEKQANQPQKQPSHQSQKSKKKRR